MLMVTTTVRLEKYLSVGVVGSGSGYLTWSTGFMATPRVFGHELRLTANLCLARDASVESLVYPQFKDLHQTRTQQRLVCPSTSSNDPDHPTHRALDHLLRTTRQLDTSLSSIRVVSNDSDIVAAGPAQCTTITLLLLHIRHHGSFWHDTEWEHIADGERSVLASVDKLPGVHALVGDEGLGVELEAVGIAEDDFG